MFEIKDQKTHDILWKLHAEGYQAYLVGGAVRDALRHNEYSDYDLATNATPDQITDLFKDTYKLDFVGTNFKVSMVDGIEVATFRKDIYLENILLKVEFAKTIEEDLGRRDLTMNSMAYDPFKQELIDPYGGRKDLKRKVVRFTGDPVRRIIEDPLRVFRACRFLALTNSKFDMKSFEAMRNAVKNGFTVPAERIRIEILKAMKAKKASKFFRALHNIGALKEIFPELEDGHTVDGGKFHDETVFEHNMEVGDAIPRGNSLLKLAGYLHDIGKPISHLLNCDGSFKRHEREGSRMAKRSLKALKFSTMEISFIENIIYFHMRTLTPEMSDKAVRRLLAKFEDYGIYYKDYLALKFADRNGNLKSGPYTEEEEKMMRKKFELEAPITIASLKVSGRDLIDELGFKAGPEIGEVLRRLRQTVIADPSMNTRESLLKIAKE
jgi:tRNA nucleotidyltransferase/poly(A) polymerase